MRMSRTGGSHAHMYSSPTDAEKPLDGHATKLDRNNTFTFSNEMDTVQVVYQIYWFQRLKKNISLILYLAQLGS